MHVYQHDFLAFALARQVLRFGDFTLKSGRQSPYFFNAGLFNTGQALAQLGTYYAATIQQAAIDFDILFGPAYKGIPLVATTAIALATHYDRDVPYCFNRKEIKDHGEGGNLIGAPLAGRVLLIDDVISAGTAVRESFRLIQVAGAQLAGIVIALDRQERGEGAQSAVAEIAHTYQVPVFSIVKLADLVAYLAAQPDYPTTLAALQQYQAQFGA